MTGNEVIGEAAIRAGCDCYFGYPITPQNEIPAYMSKHMPEKGRVFVQAESELAAINMVFGASVAGKRAMTTSSSPGISLKMEGISYLAAARLPGVIVNVQRGGPGLGNIAPAQSDYFQATKGGGHGDYHLIVLAPASVQECHDLTIKAFELSDKHRTPVMVLIDGGIGKTMEPVVLHEGPPPRVPPKPWALTGARKRKPRFIRSLFLVDGELEQHNDVLQESYRRILAEEIRYVETATDDCDVLLVAYGLSARIANAALQQARADGMKVGLLRPVTLWPFPYGRLEALSRSVRRMLVVEMSSGQMVEDVQLAVAGRVPVDFYGRTGGGLPLASAILARLRAGSGAEKAGTYACRHTKRTKKKCPR
ncbi:MAG: 3-methyl-2-oxobutanoate dehydrogenase subunit VorB [Kiritimatiellae bacterium]|nr:3-methyl-2-oxobutanoate dehydrogenase subunit VorB [Kiritimatiellia bacterium]